MGNPLLPSLVKYVKEWYCKNRLAMADWNKKVNEFYLKLGARRMEERTVQRLEKETI